MKVLVVLLVLIVSFSLQACSSVEVDNLQVAKSEPVLEIFQKAKGSFEVTGKSLFFRLYDDGVVEYEFADPGKRTAGHNQIEEIKSLETMRLNSKKLRSMKNLLNSPEFVQMDGKYIGAHCTDAFLDLDILIRSDRFKKSIALENFCEIGDVKVPGDRTDIPKPLSELIILVDNIRVH